MFVYATHFAARVINKTATVGDSVTLVCNSSLATPVNWWYKRHLDSDETEVVVNGELVNGNEVRMTIIGHDLIIHNVLPNDTGVYTCVENIGFNEQHKTLLTVSGFMIPCSFLLRDAMLARYMLSSCARPSVCSSVRPSVCLYVCHKPVLYRNG